jgi:hypothetical protein
MEKAMTVTCPNCGATEQEVGKFCENCGFFIDSADAKAPVAPTPDPNASPTPTTATTATSTPPLTTPTSGIVPPQAGGTPPPQGSAQFCLVLNGKVDPAEGFTITRAGEYLIGRTDVESGSQADIDVRQWVQPMDIHGQKQYLVHRKQCYVSLKDDGTVTIRACPGAELDTLVKPADSATFTPLQTLGIVRNANPDTSYNLDPGDQIFMGDPDALPFYQQNAPTAAGSYLVLELLPRA